MKAIVYGAGAYAKVFYHEIRITNAFDIDAFAVDSQYINNNNDSNGNELYGIPIVDIRECPRLFPIDTYQMFVLCGYSKMRARKSMFEIAKNMGYSMPNYVSPNALLEDGVVMGENNIIFSNAFIGAHGILGNNNLIRQNVYLGHNFQIGSHNIISAGCTIGGNAHINDCTFIGLGATIIDTIAIGTESLIGAGSTVINDPPEYSKCVGTPARILSTHPDTGVIISQRNSRQ